MLREIDYGNVEYNIGTFKQLQLNEYSHIYTNFILNFNCLASPFGLNSIVLYLD